MANKPDTAVPDPFDPSAAKDQSFTHRGRDRVFVGVFPGRDGADVEVAFGSVDDLDDRGNPKPNTIPAKGTIDGVAWARVLASKPHKAAVEGLIAREVLTIRDAA